MPRNTRPLRYIRPKDADPNTFFGRKYYFQNFKDAGCLAFPFTVSASTGVGAFAASPSTINTTNRLYVPGSPFLWDHWSYTAQTNYPLATASGLEISGDEANNEGVELVPGCNVGTNPLAMVTGTDSDFFFRAKFKLTDASGLDQFGIGFRKQEAFINTPSFDTGDPLYTDFVLLGFAGASANPNTVRIASDIGNEGTVDVASTGFTWADGLVHKLEIRVKSRVVQYLINDVPLGGTISKDGEGNTIAAQATSSGPAYTFTSGLTLIPMIVVWHAADIAEDTFLQEVEYGHLVDIGLDPGQE